MKIIKKYPEVAIQEILFAMSSVLQRIDMHQHHKIKLDMISTRERMSRILSSLNSENFIPFNSLFDLTEGRAGVIGTFLALMELIRESMVEIVQSDSYAPIHIKCHP
jgi:segregation and condensation protein A